MRRHLFVVLAIFLLAPAVAFSTPSANAQDGADWPRARSDWFFEIVKDPDASPTPFEEWDLQWLHLHRNHPTLPDAPVNVIAPRIVSGYSELDPNALDLQVRYRVRDVAVSGWLSAPFRFALRVDNDGLAELADGVHGLTIEARGPDRLLIQPLPAFVHISRDLAAGEPFGFERSVPILNIVQENPSSGSFPHFGPGIVYVDPSERSFDGFPIDPTATPWSTPPAETELYQELMAPHSELFHAVQMWWDHPAHSDAPFVRGLTPKHGEDHRSLRVADGHERFPMKDGPRGIGWMSPYVAGQIDSQGRFAFAEAGGRVGYVLPDGEIITIAGLRVQPDRDPIWWEKPTEAVHRNMEVRGTWTAGRGEFNTPLDVAVDPRDESVLYVAAYEDNVIWKVQVPANPRTQQATVSILAGDPGHGSGFADGRGSAARFNGPASLVFDPVADVLYVADQDNDAIRRVTRSGRVTTVAGDPGMRARLTSAGVSWTDQLAARTATQFEVTRAQAEAGTAPDIYMPQSIRVDSQGNIVLLELGYGAIRQIDPASLETTTLAEVRQKHQEFSRGWAWLDVDRWGNSGPKDGIYWTKFVSTLPGERFNEVYEWVPPGGGESVPIFPEPTGLYPDGWGRRSATNPPHYGWLIAVDPRGGLLLAGGGEHGMTRLRPRRAGDAIESREDYWLGRQVYNAGTPIDAPVASQSIALKHGWGGHNYLGLTDAWSLEGATARELLDAFEVPASVRNDPDARRQVLAFIRPNTVGATDGPPPPPPPTPTPPPPTPTPDPEPSTVDIRSGVIRVDDQWQRVAFDTPMTNPIVAAPSLSTRGAAPSTVQLRNIDETGFDVRVAEWPYLNGAHNFEDIAWVAVPRGRHTLPDGSTIKAAIVRPGETAQFVSRDYGRPLDEPPVLLAGMTTGGSDRVYTARFQNVSADSFQIEVREQESIARGIRADAVVHVLAWEPGSGRNGDLVYEVGRTGKLVGHRPFELSFDTTFASPPALLAQMQTAAGRDPSNVRTANLGRRGANLTIAEEQSADDELSHTNEIVGYAALLSGG